MTPVEAVTPASAAPRAKRAPNLLVSILVLMRKDLLIEWRTRARITALIFFGVCTLLMFSFALGANAMALRQHAGGYFWLAILFASTLSLSETFRIENENQSMDGLKLAPANPRAIFLAKAFGNTLMLWFLGAVLSPLAIAVFDLKVRMGLLLHAEIMLVGSMAISGAGTFYAAISANARARDVLLPILLFPVLVPVLIASVKSTTLVFDGDPMLQMGDWLSLLWKLNVIYWALGLVLFPRIVEDS